MMNWQIYVNVTLTALHSHINPYQRCKQPPSNVKIIRNLNCRKDINSGKSPDFFFRGNVISTFKIYNLEPFMERVYKY